MRPSLFHGWRGLALRGATTLAFGLATLVAPAISPVAFGVVFAAFAVADGALGLALTTSLAPSPRRAALVVKALLGMAIGSAALVWHEATNHDLVVLVALWALVGGAIEVALGVVTRDDELGRGLFLVVGLTTVSVGALLLGWPHAAALGVLVLFGGYTILVGATLLSFALRLRRAL